MINYEVYNKIRFLQWIKLFFAQPPSKCHIIHKNNLVISPHFASTGGIKFVSLQGYLDWPPEDSGIKIFGRAAEEYFSLLGKNITTL